jgi:hypothetical protein
MVPVGSIESSENIDLQFGNPSNSPNIHPLLPKMLK